MTDESARMPYYSVGKLADLAHLRQLFPTGEADYMNLVMFSTSGVHGSYLSIEDVIKSLDTDEPAKLTTLVIRPRIVQMLYGEIEITADDVPYLEKLRESSKRAFAEQ